MTPDALLWEPGDESEEDERDLTCEDCGGSGADSWESFMPCEHCDGEGYRWWE